MYFIYLPEREPPQDQLSQLLRTTPGSPVSWMLLDVGVHHADHEASYMEELS